MEQLAQEIKAFLRGIPLILFHLVVVALSASIAISLPVIAAFLSQDFLIYWSLIANEQVALITVEIAVALLLIAGINYVRRSIQDRTFAEMTSAAGLTHCFRKRTRLAARKIKMLKNQHGLARNVLLIGVTGYKTFADPQGDLRATLENCLEAEIMLLNPYSHAARTRARAIANETGEPEHFPEQVDKCIEFLQKLRAEQKPVRLKLYSDAPHMKLAILGDYVWLQHYHKSRNVHTMPEYVYKHNPSEQSLYTLFYQYFIDRWQNPDIPEYDLETDELLYKNNNGSLVRREKFQRWNKRVERREDSERLVAQP